MSIVAAGHRHEFHVATSSGPLCRSSASLQFAVVGMGPDHEDSKLLFRLRHEEVIFLMNFSFTYFYSSCFRTDSAKCSALRIDNERMVKVGFSVEQVTCKDPSPRIRFGTS